MIIRPIETCSWALTRACAAAGVNMPLKMVWVTFQREGIHCYPDAPEEVSFLKHPHRHIFHFEVAIEVFHDDRDIEFIMFKRELEGLYSSGTLQCGHKSCEMLADELAKYISTKYPGRQMSISVSEDGENGSQTWYPGEILDENISRNTS